MKTKGFPEVKSKKQGEKNDNLSKSYGYDLSATDNGLVMKVSRPLGPVVIPESRLRWLGLYEFKYVHNFTITEKEYQ